MKNKRVSIFDIIERTPFGRLNLRGKLTAGNIFIVFLVVLGMGLFLYLRTRFASEQLNTQLEENIRNRAEENLLTTSREQANLLNVFFTTMSRNTSTMGSSVKETFAMRNSLGSNSFWDASQKLTRLDSGSWDNPNGESASVFVPAAVEITDSLAIKLNTLKHTELFLPSLLADNPDIIAIYFGGTTKETIYYPNIDLAAIVPPDFDVTGRPWFVNAAPTNNPTGEVVWSTPYQDAALNGLVITASVPVVDAQDRFQGVAAMDIQLTQITDIVASIKAGETGYAFLVDENNRMIALPQAGVSDFNLIDEAASIGEIMDPNTLPNAAPQLFDILKTIAATNEGIFNITLGNAERLVAFQQVPEVDYKLVIMVPAGELLADASLVREEITTGTRTTLSISLLLIVAVFILASVVSLAIGNRLTSPLQDLTQIAKEITAGDLDARANIHTQDEIGTLAETLNAMASSLSRAIHSLEQRVDERTSALQIELLKGERRSQQYEAVAKVSQAITTTQNLNELLPQISKVISHQFGFYHTGIFLTDASRQYAVLAAANSEGGKKMLKRGHQLRVGQQGIVGYVTDTGQPRIALNVGGDAVYFNNPDLPATRSEMALPLTISGEVIGALDVQSTEPNAFSDDDVEVLTTLADQVSIAIQNARLFEQIQRSLAEAEAVSRRYFKETWSQIAQEQQITGFSYSPAGVIPLKDASVSAEGKPDPKDSNERRQVSVPIVIRGRTVGELSVMVPRQEHIRNDQMNLIHAVADRVALFAENARLFDQTSKRAERERLVSDITTKIRGTNDPTEMVETAIKELRAALNVSRIEIIPQKVTSPDR